MTKIKEKIETIKKKIKIALKIKDVFSFISSKVAIITSVLTIKHAVEEAWENSKSKRM